jgi:inner membrane transporter RhtA
MFLPALLLLLAMGSFQVGASLTARYLFPYVGAQGATAQRVAIAAILLLLIYRPWRTTAWRGRGGTLLCYGLTLGAMNLFFYMAILRIPLGIAVAIEFLGPLSVATLASRRRLDYLWVAIAFMGLAMLLPITHSAPRLDALGLLYAALAALFWALYIVFGQRAGAAGLASGSTVAIGMTIAMLVVVPPGILEAGAALLDPALLPMAFVVATVSSAIPYVIEMYAMARIPARTFGIFMSIEPALAAIAGFALLGNMLTAAQWMAILCVVLASLGSAATNRAGGSTI